MNQNDPKPKWTERYNCHSLRLASGFRIGVNWTSTRTESGYRVSFEHATLKGNVSDLAAAKQAGIALARRMLSQSLKELESL